MTPDLGAYLTATTGPGEAQDGIAGLAASDTASAAEPAANANGVKRRT